MINNFTLKKKIKFDELLNNSAIVLSKKGINCHNIEFKINLINDCEFIEKTNTKNLYLIGGSQLELIGYYLKKRLKLYNYFHYTSGGFVYLPGERKKNDSSFIKRNTYIKNKLLSSSQNSILIIHGRYPVYLKKSLFDNQEKNGKESGNGYTSIIFKF